jgi:hypothetical protein
MNILKGGTDKFMENNFEVLPRLNSIFPCVVYHVVEGDRTISNQKDLDFYLERGWSQTPVKYSEKAALESKIAFYKSETIRLEKILYGMIEEVSEKEKKQNTTEENLDSELVMDQKKIEHRGRPKKKV